MSDPIKVKNIFISDTAKSIYAIIGIILFIGLIVSILIGVMWLADNQLSEMHSSQTYKNGYDLGYKEHNQTRYEQCCKLFGNTALVSTKIGEYKTGESHTKEIDVFGAGYIDGANAWLIEEPINNTEG